MAFYDRFLDRLADIMDEYESNRRTSGRRRYTGSGDTGYRYSRHGMQGDLRKKQTEDEEELRRYAGLYRSVKKRGEAGEDADGGNGSGREGYDDHEEYDEYNDRYDGEDGMPRGLSPLKRRKYMREERERLSGADRPGHVFDDIEEKLSSDEDADDIAPTFGIGKRLSEEEAERGRSRRRDGYPGRGGDYIGDHNEHFDNYDIRNRRTDGNSRYTSYAPYDRDDGRGYGGRRSPRYDVDPYNGGPYGDRRRPARYTRGSYDHRSYEDRGYGRRSRYDRSDRSGDPYGYPPDAPAPRKKRMSMGKRITLIVLAAVFVTAQTIIFGSIMTKPRPKQEEIPEVDYSGSSVNGDYALTDPEAIYKQQAKQIVAVMSAEQKVGQLIVAASQNAEGKKLSDDDFCALVSATDASGVLIRQEDAAGRAKDGFVSFIEKLQQASGNGELFVMTEEEGGAKVAISSNSSLRKSSFRSAQAMYVSGGLSLISEDASEKSEFLRELGINVNIAPMCDVVTSTKGFMYSRSYGKRASDTSEYVSEVTKRMKEKNMGCVLKFFPGYGNSEGDTRNGLIVIDTVATVLRERDMLPFKAGIEAKADAIMIAHAIVTAMDDTAPASLSPVVIDMVRNELGFDGVIMCEPLNDEGLAEYTGGEDVSVRALSAGIDLLLAPQDAPATRSAVLEAVYNGTVPQERIDEAVTRVLTWKLRLGIIKADG